MSTRAKWVAATLFWVFIAALSGLQIWLLSQQPGEQIALGRALVWQSTFYLAWIPFTVPLWLLVARRTTESVSLWSLIGVHLAVSVVVALAHSGLAVVIASSIAPTSSEPFGQMLVGQVRGRIYLQIVIYVGIVAMGHAWAWQARWREQSDAAARLQAQLADARLASLRAQLDPHFLFNSLHAVSSLVRESRNAEAVRLIADMSELLRRVLDTDRVWHPLADELALVRTYLDVQKVRFEDRLTTTIDADPDAAGVLVPVLLLQPLVENSVRHGFADKVGTGHLQILVRRREGELVVQVVDDGVGGRPVSGAESVSGGTGLSNLRARLATLYGDRARMEVSAPTHGGFVVTIRVPERMS
jgi:two-component system LytT family sensor kinase